MVGGWEGDLWLEYCWEGVLREIEVFILPPWQVECRVAVAPPRLRWRKVFKIREMWALGEAGMMGWWWWGVYIVEGLCWWGVVVVRSHWRRFSSHILLGLF